MTELLLFLLYTGILFALIRTGKSGTRSQETLPALALSSLFALGLSLITTSFLTSDTGTGTGYALIYMGIGTLLTAYLWFKGVMTRKIVLLAAVLGILAGFVFLAPIMPMELGGIINVISGASALTYGVGVICAVIALALVVGRTFCGTICPVGLLQELVYAVPVKKIVIQHTRVLELIRLAVFGVTVIAAFYLIDLMSFTGLYRPVLSHLLSWICDCRKHHTGLGIFISSDLQDYLSLWGTLLPLCGVQLVPVAAQ